MVKYAKEISDKFQRSLKFSETCLPQDDDVEG